VSFASPLFLFAFLPVAALVHALVPARARNPWIIVASLLFYAWGSLPGTAALLFCAAVNLGAAAFVDRAPGALSRAVVLTLLPLLAYKYLPFFGGLFASALGTSVDLSILVGALPPGISFFTFQAIAYSVDVARGVVRKDASGHRFLTSLVFFPQLIAGPIVRYRDVAEQVASRALSFPLAFAGLERFGVGLAKKVLLADAFAVPADVLFAREALSFHDAWLAVASYSLQIYFDFSAYSDMAIGIGMIFGFRLPENFRWPYAARSITDFWRRWHMTLSSWFRDYVYIPLGGNRGGSAKTARNLFVVFVLCGLWHGASWTFLAWGLAHGALLSLERLGLGRLLERLPRGAAHLYVGLAVALTWVLFRSESLPHATRVWASLLGLVDEPSVLWLQLAQPWALVGIGLVGASGLPAAAVTRAARALPPSLLWLRGLALLGLLVVCAAALAAQTHTPFIYFQF
jgi:alginate O-acetyltransferase complex protein AlgI